MARIRRDVTGMSFGRLLVLGYSHRDKHGNRWLVKCSCGKIKTINISNLKQNGTQSCGCFQREQIQKIKTTHGMSGSALVKTYRHMLERCYDEEDQNYHNYGGRGIHVCDRWLGKEGLLNFIKDMGNKPKGLELDRINNSGNYEPENCRWVTHMEQSRNKRPNIYVSIFLETQVLKDVCSEWGLAYRTVHKRHRKGWPMACSLFASKKSFRTPQMIEKRTLNALKY